METSLKHVELLGIPGAGKTTTVEPVCDSLREHGIRPMLPVELLRVGISREWSFYPGVVLRILPRSFGRRLACSHFVVDGRLMKGITYHHALYALCERYLEQAANARAFSSEEVEKVRRWFYRLVGSYALFERSGRPEEALVLEEGFALRAITLFAYGQGDIQRAVISSYAREMPAPDMVYFLVTTPETALRRIRSRDWIPSRLVDKGDFEILAFLRRAAEIAELTAGILEKRGTSVLRIDAEPQVSAVEQAISLSTPQLADTGPAV